jgi:hypothetical protein
VGLTSQNCGLYEPIVHPRVICDMDHGMIILTEPDSQHVYQIAVAATSTLWLSCRQRRLWQPPVLAGGPVSRDVFGSPPVLFGCPVSRDVFGSPQYWLALLSAETSLVATSTVRRCCHPRYVWSEWGSGRRK